MGGHCRSPWRDLRLRWRRMHYVDDLRNEAGNVLLGDRPKARHRVRIVEIPPVFHGPDEIANGGVGAPGAAKRRTSDFLGHSGAEKAANIGVRRDGIEGG